MRRLFYSTIILATLYACKEDTNKVVEPGKTVVYKQVDGDVSDVALHRAYAFDVQVEGTLDYDENFFHSSREYDLTLPFYKASYEAGGMPISNPEINKSAMCTDHQCDSSQVRISGVFYRYGVKPRHPSFTWKFVTVDQGNGYEVTMNELPGSVVLPGDFKYLSTSTDNVLDFEYQGADSLLCRLLVIPKSNLQGRAPLSGGGWTQINFRAIAEGNRFVLPAKSIPNTINSSIDTVFINVTSMKRVIKIIEGKRIAINYRKNHIHPVSIQ